jgi:hypothetical protein
MGFCEKACEIVDGKNFHPYTDLEVSEVFSHDKQSCTYLSKIVSQWEGIANLRAQKCGEKETERRKIFFDLESVAESMKDCFYMARDKRLSRQIFICKSHHSIDIQAIAITALDMSNTLNILWLITNPRNVRGNLSGAEVSGGVKGAGSAIIYHIATHLPIGCAKVVVIPLNSSMYFYEKLGFEYESIFYMYLTVEKIRELIYHKAA